MISFCKEANFQIIVTRLLADRVLVSCKNAKNTAVISDKIAPTSSMQINFIFLMYLVSSLGLF